MRRPELPRRRRDERAAVAALQGRAVNFDPARAREYTPANGWHVDDYRHALPSETPGSPEPGGAWEVARRLLGHYEFADPRRVRAYWTAGAPLEGRDMLLVLRFRGLRFRTGVRVSEVWDEEVELDGRPARLWGWGYRTLAGHLECGQMNYTVHKFTDTGDVEFRIHAYSRRAHVANPLVRLGFRLFGRREQVAFARFAVRRMAELTTAVLARGPGAEPVPARRDGLEISPSPERDDGREAIARQTGVPGPDSAPRGGSSGSTR